MIRTLSAATLALVLSAPALAQDENASIEKPTMSDVSRDSLTIGVGAAIIPRYDGSNQYYVTPIGGLRGKVSGVSFNVIGLSAFADVIPASAPTGGKFVFGPMGHLTLNRTNLRRSRDGRIALLGDLKPAFELGAHAGYQWTGVITSDYDVLSVDVAVSHDITDIHNSYVVTPSINYGTPLSKRTFVGLTLAADYTGGGYARTYYGVTPAQSARSGFPTYTLGAGFNSVSAGLIGAYSLSGDLRRGWAVFAAGNYWRLVGETARSPVVRDTSQLIGALGVAYTF